MAFQFIRVPQRIDGGDMEIWLTMKDFNRKLVKRFNCVALSAKEEETFARRGYAVLLDERVAKSAKEQTVGLDATLNVEDILKRFDSAGMSLGALSPEAHEALAIAMNRIGARSNSGE